MAIYTVRTNRYLRQYTASGITSFSDVIADGQAVVDSLCALPWQLSAEKDAGFPWYGLPSCEGNAAARGRYDGALFDGERNETAQTHRVMANAACYLMRLPESAVGLTLNSVTVDVTSDAHNAGGARIAVFTNETGAIPTDCATCRTGNAYASGIAPRRSVTTDTGVEYGESAASCTVSKDGGIVLGRYLMVFVLMENYAPTSALEGASRIANRIVLDLSEDVPEWKQGVLNDLTTDIADGNARMKTIIGSVAGFVGAAAITVGTLWFGGEDADVNDVPDAWEQSFPCLREIESAETRASFAADGDLMASAVIERGLLVASNVTEGAVAPFMYDPVVYPNVSVGAALNGVRARCAFAYGDEMGVGTNVTLSGWKVVGFSRKAAFRLVHWQVYDEFGYDVTTAAKADGTRTKPFTARDKYLLARLFGMYGMVGTNEAAAAESPLRPVPFTTLVPGDRDYDKDGAPDGWELYVMFGPRGAEGNASGEWLNPWDATDATTDYDGDGVTMSEEANGGKEPLDPWFPDSDFDGVPDRYVQTYHLRPSEAPLDADGDGLSNYTEYLVSEVFKFARLDPDNPRTDDYCLDYFRRVGNTYLGFVFQDEDHVDDSWETAYSRAANASVYDPYRDDDMDGFDNWSEAMAGTDPTKSVSVGVDGLLVDETPVPIVKANIVYNGKRKVGGNLVVECYRTGQTDGAPDAKWTLASASESVDGDGNTMSEDATGSKYVGRNPNASRTYKVGSGTIVEGSFKILFKNLSYEAGVMERNVFKKESVGDPTKAVWAADVIDRGGMLYDLQGNREVGSIDYANGLVTVDFCSSALAGSVVSEMVVEKTLEDGTKTNALAYARSSLPSSHVMFTWVERLVALVPTKTYYLSDADVQKNGVRGHVRQGSCMFVAYVDSDRDGIYKPGDPYGVVREVDVGWSSGSFDLEMTDVSPVFARIDLVTGACDRKQYESSREFEDYGHRATFFRKPVSFVTVPEGQKARIRVVRYGYNDFYVDTCYNSENNYTRVLVDKTFDTSVHRFVTEADVIDDEDQYDVDFDHFYSDCSYSAGCKMATQSVNGSQMVSNVTYLAVVGDGKCYYGVNETNDVSAGIKAVGTYVESRFEINRTKPVISEPNMTLYEARPTFRWRMPNEEAYAKVFDTSYTAFRVQVLSEDEQTAVYDSSYQRTPVQRLSKTGDPAEFVWTAPVCVGDLTDQGVIFANNTTYHWKVSMYNSKFKDDKWSDSAHFTSFVQTNSTASSVGVSVKYTGHTNVLAYVSGTNMRGKLRVQAFTSQDFTGDPVASAVVQDRKSIQDTTDTSANATLIGLTVPGTYYVRAFLDSNSNGKKDVFESWCAAKSPVVLSEKNVQPLVNDLYLDDADENDNKIPDAYEYTLGDLAWRGAWDSRKGEIPTTVRQDGKMTVPSSLAESVLARSLACGVSSCMKGASFGLLCNPLFVHELVGLASNVTVSAEEMQQSVRNTLRPNYVTVKGVSLDGGGVTLYTDPTVDYVNGGTVAWQTLRRYIRVAESNDAALASVTLYSKSRIETNEWSEVGTGLATMTRNTNSVHVAFVGIDVTNRLYRVEVRDSSAQ